MKRDIYHPATVNMPAFGCTRPSKLYRYSERRWLQRSLTAGEFRLRPIEEMKSSPQILPFQPLATRSANTAIYLALSLSTAWDHELFDEFPGADCCLIIHDVEEFGERIHRAAEAALPAWAGIDAAVSYGVPSALGHVFSKARQHANEKEWQFAWRPTQPMALLKPVNIHIGSIEHIAELHEKGH
jgi:hypothetical protein